MLEGHQDRLTSAHFSPNCRTVVTASDDKTARLLGGGHGQGHRCSSRPRGWCYVRSISPDGRLVATASADKTARLWDAVTAQEIMTLRGHEADIYSVVFSPDSRTLVTASADRTARVWRAERPSLRELVSEACRRLAR